MPSIALTFHQRFHQHVPVQNDGMSGSYVRINDRGQSIGPNLKLLFVAVNESLSF